jgi:hypothetical protein
MATGDPKRPWEQQLRDAAAHLETDLKNVVKYINDEVVPEVGRTGLRRCALRLLNCTSWRSEWMTMRAGRRGRLHLRLHRRMRRSRDARPGCLRYGDISVRTDGWWLSPGDYAGVSATTAAGDEYGCDS